MRSEALPKQSFLLLLFFANLVVANLCAATELPRITEGPAGGYVEDQVCRDCHVSHYDSYQHVGMAQSFKSVPNAKRIEKFGEVFYHELSNRYYQMLLDGDDMTFRRFQKDASGNEINSIEVPVDWVLGSGNRTRSYLYQTDHGEIFQLPIGWYTEGQYWEMSPGFEAPDHQGLTREITRECMFCHNALPEIKDDAHGAANHFPKELPEGTGCQRCHGPGGQHVTNALTGKGLDGIRSAIVNPGKLTGARRDSVCMQCHLLPAITVTSPVRFGRGQFSFRPGELLSDYLYLLDVEEGGISDPDRFEINHHGYRLMKSACYSEGGITCIDCHNPHVKPESNTFREEVAGVCQDCHESVNHQVEVSANQCVACHMPTRRTRDVVHVTMTDHWIAKGPFNPEKLTAPVNPETRPVTDVRPLPFGNHGPDEDMKTYEAVAVIRASRSVDIAVQSLMEALSERQYEHYSPYLDLAQGWLKLGNFAQAEAFARGLVNGDPNLAVAHDILGLSQMALGKTSQAKLSFRRSLALQPEPEVHLALASLYFDSNSLTLADVELDKALALRPLMARAYRMKGRISSKLGNGTRAAEHFRRSLEIDPGDHATYEELAVVLNSSGQAEEAERYLKHMNQIPR